MSRLEKQRFTDAFNRSKPKDLESQGGEEDPKVQELWKLLEPVLEDRGRYDAEVRAHMGHVGEHVKECTKDIVSWRSTRGFALAFAVAIVLVILIVIGLSIFDHTSTIALKNLGNDNVKIAFIGGCFAILFGLPALILKGAFSSNKKDEADGALPEGAKVLMEAILDVTKGR